MQKTWGLGIEHEMRIRFEKNIYEIPENIVNQFFKNMNSKYIFIDSELLLYYFYLYEINFSNNFIKYYSQDSEYLNIIESKKKLFTLAKNGHHYPINDLSYKNKELINYYIFFYCLYNSPLCFLRYNIKLDDSIKIGFNDLPDFDNLPDFLENLYNKTFERNIYRKLKSIIDDYNNKNRLKTEFQKNNNIIIKPISSVKKSTKYIYDLEYINKKTVYYIKRPRIDIYLHDFTISNIYKFVENFKKMYNDDNINFKDSKDLYLLYKNRIPEIDLSDKTTSIEFKTIEFKNNNYEKTLDDLINLESVFFEAMNLIPIFKIYINYFGKLTYHNIGSVNKSIVINNLINFQYSDVKNDYTGSYHLWITCPYNKKLSMENFLKIHESLANKLQLLEPIFLAHFGSPSYNIIENKITSKSSLRHFLNKYSNYGTTDISLINGRKESFIDEYFFSEEDIINNKPFIEYNKDLYKKVYVYDYRNDTKEAKETKEAKDINYENKKINNNKMGKILKIDYNYLNTRNITNNLFNIFDIGSTQPYNNIDIKNYFTLLFEKTNIRPETYEENDGHKYYLKLGADFRTRNYDSFFYPLDKEWIPKILLKNNEFIEVYYNPENKKISYHRIYDKNLFKKKLEEERIGIEFRILDHFPTNYLNQILSILGPIVLDSLNNRKTIPLKKLHISKQYWHNEMYDVITNGYEYKLNNDYIKEINKEFSINLNVRKLNTNYFDTTQFLSEFYKIMNLKYMRESFYDKIRFHKIIKFKSFNRIAWFEILDSYFEKNPFIYKKLKDINKLNKNFNNLVNIINKKNDLYKFKNYFS